MAADALNEVWDAIGQQQAADKFEHVEVPQHCWLPFIHWTHNVCGTLQAKGSRTLSYASTFRRCSRDALASSAAVKVCLVSKAEAPTLQVYRSRSFTNTCQAGRRRAPPW